MQFVCKLNTSIGYPVSKTMAHLYKPSSQNNYVIILNPAFVLCCEKAFFRAKQVHSTFLVISTQSVMSSVHFVSFFRNVCEIKGSVHG